MKVLTIICLTFLTAISAYAEDPPTPAKAPVEAKNEIILIPTLHRGHLRKGEFYNLERLASIIKEVKVDFICTEIATKSFHAQRGQRNATIKLSGSKRWMKRITSSSVRHLINTVSKRNVSLLLLEVVTSTDSSNISASEMTSKSSTTALRLRNKKKSI